MIDKQEIRELAQTGADIQQTLQDAGVAATKSTLETQLGKQRTAAAGKAMDKASGVAGKQRGIAKATASKSPKVEVARRIARDLAANGPITVDDVTEVLIQKGYEKADRAPGDSPSKWKGAIFRSSEWICVDDELARLTRSNARTNKVWALKSWLEKNSMNGKNLSISRFNIEGIRRDFARANPNVDGQSCHWFVGTSRLADDIAHDIRQAGNAYDKVPVTFIPYAVGAILQYVPPQVPLCRPDATVPAAKPSV